eukprot:6307075-Pyramimonas_sp.AAC.1
MPQVDGAVKLEKQPPPALMMHHVHTRITGAATQVLIGLRLDTSFGFTFIQILQGEANISVSTTVPLCRIVCINVLYVLGSIQ